MVALPRIRDAGRGNVEMLLPDGVTVMVADNETNPANIVDEDDPSFEPIRHMLAFITENGRTLGDAARSTAFKDRMKKVSVTLSSRIEI